MASIDGDGPARRLARAREYADRAERYADMSPDELVRASDPEEWDEITSIDVAGPAGMRLRVAGVSGWQAVVMVVSIALAIVVWFLALR